MSSLAYLLGRKSAPLFFKVNWVLKSLAGTEAEKIEAEFQMGCLLAQAYEEQVPSLENNRLSNIAAKLETCLTSKRRKYRFKLDRSDQLNAIAIPGGFIFCSEKLFDLCGEDSAAIAFILAHEVAHGIYGDANKRFLTKTALNALLRVKSRGFNPALKQLFAQLIEKGYSREQEFRADRFAVSLLKSAGFDPAGGIRLFQALRKISAEPGAAGAYFSSHPAAAERITQIDRLIRPESRQPPTGM